jgi:hypothetical protein
MSFDRRAGAQVRALNIGKDLNLYSELISEYSEKGNALFLSGRDAV